MKVENILFLCRFKNNVFCEKKEREEVVGLLSLCGSVDRRWSFCSIDCKRCVAIVAAALIKWQNWSFSVWMDFDRRRNPIFCSPSEIKKTAPSVEQRQQLIYVRFSLSFCLGSTPLCRSLLGGMCNRKIKPKLKITNRFVTNKISKFLCWVKRRYKSSQCAPFFPCPFSPKKKKTRKNNTNRIENKAKPKSNAEKIWTTGKLATLRTTINRKTKGLRTGLLKLFRFSVAGL